MSILLTENDIGFYNIMISTLFNCMRIVWHFTCFVWNFAYFTVMTNKWVNIKLESSGYQQHGKVVATHGKNINKLESRRCPCQ
jgi:hypothetical protein